MIIKCKHWSESNEYFRGRCSLGKYKGRPTFGRCVNECKQCENTVDELETYIKVLAKKERDPIKSSKQDEERAFKSKYTCYNGCEHYRKSCKTGEYCLFLTRMTNLREWLKAGKKCPMGKF